MKRIVALCLLLSLLLLAACGAAEQAKENVFTVTLTNDSEDAYHGFGVEWYEDGQLVETETAMKRDFLFLRNGEKCSCELTFDTENLPEDRDCAVRVYIIGTNHALYCMDKPLPVDFASKELLLTVTGSEEEGWKAE